MDDAFDLQRFVGAQAPVIEDVLGELLRGSKTSHWMWFVFPQIAGLGMSATSRRFAISGRLEAEAYLAHPILGPRLRQCCALLMRIEGRSANRIFGSPDDRKLQSSMTLFASVAADRTIFDDVLRKYFGAEPDRATLERL